MAEQAAFRFGRDTLTRIAGTAQMTTLAAEVLPGEPMYAPIPFYPPSITSGDGTVTGLISSGSERPQWVAFPDPLDIYVYQGDDVQIPLYFQDPTDPTLDMSNEAGWEWKAQIRICHTYRSPIVNEFTIESNFIPSDDPDEGMMGSTLVKLFLPRMHNQYIGTYDWDLQSKGPFDGPVYPQPPDVEEWPMTHSIKTWLYGKIIVVPRVTETDFLPLPVEAVTSGGSGLLLANSPAGWFVGPNGKVP